MTKFELHVHTSECDKAATVSGAEIVRLYYERGYSGMVVTDHCFSLFYDWFSDELKGANHQKIIDRWLKGYYTARNEGEKLGFTVLPGAEVRFDGSNINDYLIYGIDEQFFYDAPLLNQLKNVQELMEIIPNNACIVQAHPFRNGMVISDPSAVFGFEVYNGGTEKIRNDLAKLYAEYYGKCMTSGSDFHHKHALGKGGIITKQTIHSPADLVSVLRSGDYNIISYGDEEVVGE